MLKEYFDLALEGTTLEDLFLCDPSCKTVVIDKSGNYGTTYSCLSSLENSPYISNYKLIKDIRKKNNKVFIESIPMVLGSNSQILKNFSVNAFGKNLDFVDISDIFIITDVKTRIPTNKNDISALDLSNSDLFHLYKAMEKRDLEIIKKKFRNVVHPLYKALIQTNVLDAESFEIICENFGKSPFVYPLFGVSEISESASLKNSFKGTTYVLNQNLVYEEESNNEYKHKFTCDVGMILAKEYKSKAFSVDEQNVRVVLTSTQKFNGNFIAYLIRPTEFILDPNTISYSDKYTKVIGINYITEVCPDELQLLYFIRKHGQPDNFDLEKLLISEKDILLDLTFTSKYKMDL